MLRFRNIIMQVLITIVYIAVRGAKLLNIFILFVKRSKQKGKPFHFICTQYNTLVNLLKKRRKNRSTDGEKERSKFFVHLQPAVKVAF